MFVYYVYSGIINIRNIFLYFPGISTHKMRFAKMFHFVFIVQSYQTNHLIPTQRFAFKNVADRILPSAKIHSYSVSVIFSFPPYHFITENMLSLQHWTCENFVYLVVFLCVWIKHFSGSHKPDATFANVHVFQFYCKRFLPINRERRIHFTESNTTCYTSL